MVKKEVQYFWNADIEIKIQEKPGLAFSVQTDETREKGRKINRFRMAWLNADDEVMFDAGARLRGWLKMQAKTIRPSLGDVVGYGIRVLSLPTPGPNVIAKAGDLKGWDNPPTGITENYKLPENLNGGIAYPIKEAFSVGEGKQKRAIYAFMYALEREVKLQARIFSFARGLSPEQVKWMLENLGKVAGIGDRYSRGFGLFELVSFKTNKNEEIPL